MSQNEQAATRFQNLAREVSKARNLARAAAAELDAAFEAFATEGTNLAAELDGDSDRQRIGVYTARAGRKNLSKAMRRLAKIRQTVEDVARDACAHPYGDLSTRMPKNGERLLIGARGSDMSPMDDHTGGEVTIAGWEMGKSGGEQVPFVWFEGFSRSYKRNYRMLLSEQSKLSGYRGQVARPDPDYESHDDGFGRF